MVCGSGAIAQAALALLLLFQEGVALNNGLALKPPMGYNVNDTHLLYIPSLPASSIGTDCRAVREKWFRLACGDYGSRQ